MAFLKINLKLLNIKVLSNQITYFSSPEKSVAILYAWSFFITIFFLLGFSALGESLNILLAVLVNHGAVNAYWITISSCDSLPDPHELVVTFRFFLVCFFTVVGCVNILYNIYCYYKKGALTGYREGLLLNSNQINLINQEKPAVVVSLPIKNQQQEEDMFNLSYNSMSWLLLLVTIICLGFSVFDNYSWSVIISFGVVIAPQFFFYLFVMLVSLGLVAFITYTVYNVGYSVGQVNAQYDSKKEEAKALFLKNHKQEQSVGFMVQVLFRLLLWLLSGLVDLVFSNKPHYYRPHKNSKLVLVRHNGLPMLEYIGNYVAKIVGTAAAGIYIWKEGFNPVVVEELPPTIQVVTQVTEVVKDPGLSTSTVVIGAAALVGVTSLVSYYCYRSNQLKNLEEKIGLLQEKIKFFEEHANLTFEQQWQLAEAKKKLSHLLPGNNSSAVAVNLQPVVDHPQPVVVNFEFDPNLANYSPLAAKLGLKPNPSAGDYFLQPKQPALPSFHNRPGPQVRDNADVLFSPYELYDLLLVMPPGALSVLLMVFQLGLLWVNHPYFFRLTYHSLKPKFYFWKAYCLLSLGLLGLLILFISICLY